MYYLEQKEKDVKLFSEYECYKEITVDIDFNLKDKYEIVLRTFSLSDVSFIKSVLDSEEISYYFIGENLLSCNTVLEPACLIVRENEVNIVLDILKNIKLSYIGLL